MRLDWAALPSGTSTSFVGSDDCLPARPWIGSCELDGCQHQHGPPHHDLALDYNSGKNWLLQPALGVLGSSSGSTSSRPRLGIGSSFLTGAVGQASVGEASGLSSGNAFDLSAAEEAAVTGEEVPGLGRRPCRTHQVRTIFPTDFGCGDSGLAEVVEAKPRLKKVGKKPASFFGLGSLGGLASGATAIPTNPAAAQAAAASAAGAKGLPTNAAAAQAAAQKQAGATGLPTDPAAAQAAAQKQAGAAGLPTDPAAAQATAQKQAGANGLPTDPAAAQAAANKTAGTQAAATQQVGVGTSATSGSNKNNAGAGAGAGKNTKGAATGGATQHPGGAPAQHKAHTHGPPGARAEPEHHGPRAQGIVCGVSAAGNQDGHIVCGIPMSRDKQTGAPFIVPLYSQPAAGGGAGPTIHPESAKAERMDAETRRLEAQVAARLQQEGLDLLKRFLDASPENRPPLPAGLYPIPRKNVPGNVDVITAGARGLGKTGFL